MEIKISEIEIDDTGDSRHNWTGKIWINIGEAMPSLFVSCGLAKSHVLLDLANSIGSFRDGCRAMDAPAHIIAALTGLVMQLFKMSNEALETELEVYSNPVVMKGGNNG